MPTIPERYAPAIEWCALRLPRWRSAAGLLDLTEPMLDDLEARTQAAQAAREQYVQDRLRLRNSAAEYRRSVRSMRTTAAALLARIRGVAAASEQPALVYAAASVPPPSKRGPTPAPGAPFRFTIRLYESTGALRVAFECKHPKGVRGVTYRVERVVDFGAPPEFLMIAKTRAFTDTTIPPGTQVVVYRVTPQTSTRDGRAGVHMVQFGRDPIVAASPLPQHEPQRGARAA